MYSIIKFIHKPRFYGVLLYLNGSEGDAANLLI